MEQLVELLRQIQELAGVGIEALEGAVAGAAGAEEAGGPPPEGGPEGGEEPPAGPPA